MSAWLILAGIFFAGVFLGPRVRGLLHIGAV